MQKLTTLRGLKNQIERIKLLEAKVSEIESKVGEVTTQSSETWHDNAPYSILVEELGIADRRLRDAHEELRSYVIHEYPVSLEEPRIDYGTRVKLQRNGKSEEICFVGYGETDFDKGHLAYDCPLALVLNGRLAGQAFTAEINGKSNTFFIERVTAIERD